MKPENLIAYLILVIFTILGYYTGKKFSKALFHVGRKIMKSVKLKKYHIHHDLGGLCFVGLSVFLSPLVLQIAVAGLGFGLFIHHVTGDGFMFITKNY